MTKETLDSMKMYIDRCDAVLKAEQVDSAAKLQNSILSIFSSLIPDLECGLSTNTAIFDFCYNYDNNSNVEDVVDNTDYVGNIGLLKEKLKFHFNTKGANMKTSNHKTSDKSINVYNGIYDSGNSTNTNTNTNTNNLSNTVDIKAELAKARQLIEENETLDDEDKEEIKGKIDEIETVMSEEQTNNQKWSKLKGIVSWIGTKGYTIGKIIMPTITKALFPEEGQ